MQHKVELNLENFGNNEEDYSYLQNAITELTAKNEKQLMDIKNEKWFKRVFDTVTFSKKKSIRMSEQISSISEAQDLLMEILKRMSNTDVKIDSLVIKNTEDIERLYGHTEKLTKKVKQLMDKVISGIDDSISIEDLKDNEVIILSSLLIAAANSFEETNEEQREFADKLLRYLGATARDVVLEKAIESIDSNSSRKLMFQILLEYGYLKDNDFDFNDSFQELVDLFDFGNKTIKEIKQKIVDIYRLRGSEGFSWFVREDNSEELNFTVDIEVDNHLFEKNVQSDENIYGCDYDTVVEEKIVEEKIQVGLGETLRFENKKLSINTLINVKGDLELINCEITFLDSFDQITVDNGSVLIESCTFLGEQYRDEPVFQLNESNLICKDCLFNFRGYFIDGYGSNTQITKCNFIRLKDNSFFINSKSLEIADTIVYGEKGENTKPFISNIYRAFFHGDNLETSRCSFKDLDGIFSSLNDTPILAENNNYENCKDIFKYGKVLVKNNNFSNCTNIFDMVDSSIIKNCKFIDCRELFDYCKDIEINKCTFNKVRYIFDNVSGLDIKNCIFKNCFTKDSLFVFSFFKDTSTSTIKNCLFKNIDTGRGLLIEVRLVQKTHAKVIINNNEFINVKNENEYLFKLSDTLQTLITRKWKTYDLGIEYENIFK